jgi:hypothetical protein
VYRVFIQKQPLKKRTLLTNRAEKALEHIFSQLHSLLPGTEVNVHTANETYYNALFQSFNRKTKDVSLLIDPFYKHGGQTVTVNGNDIVSLDFPSPHSSQTDEEDE